MEEILKSSGFMLVASAFINGKLQKTWRKNIGSRLYYVKVYPHNRKWQLVHSDSINSEKVISSGDETNLISRLTYYSLV